MKLSLSGRILQGGAPPMSTAEFIALARDTGFELVELRASQVPRTASAAALAAVRAALDRAGVGVSMLVIDDLAQLEAWVPIARILGTRLLRAGGPVERLRAAAAALPDDLRLAAQMHSQSPFEDVAQAAAALAGIPEQRFGLIPEPANLLFAGARWTDELFLPLRGRIYGCNAQSIALDPGSSAAVTMNDGRQIPYGRLPWAANEALDFPGFLRALRAAGYDDFVNFIDPWYPQLSVREWAASTAAYARRCLEELPR